MWVYISVWIWLVTSFHKAKVQLAFTSFAKDLQKYVLGTAMKAKENIFE